MNNKLKKIFLILGVILLFSVILEAEESSDQQFLEFQLAGYSQVGKKTWEIKGQSADIFENIIKLKNVVANVYGEEEMTLTAERGSLDKSNGDMHLEEDVVATTKTGAKMTTDSLDWKRDSDTIITEDKVFIEKENMTANGIGAFAQPNLNKAQINKDVTVTINSLGETPGGNTTVITCDGPMEIDYEKQIAVFNNNVVATDPQGKVYADRMEMLFEFKTKQIDKIICTGNVKIDKGGNLAYGDEAVYTATDRKLTLTGKPKLLIYSEGGLNAPFGN